MEDFKLWVPKPVTFFTKPSRPTAPGLAFGDVSMETKYKAFIYNVNDYVRIISNIEDPNLIPKVPLEFWDDRWIHGFYVQTSGVIPISIHSLLAKCKERKIIAFKFKKFRLLGNPCISYAFIPTILPKGELCNKSTLSSKSIIPRKLMIELIRIGPCTCQTYCSTLMIRTWTEDEMRVCSNTIPWNDILIIGGEMIIDNRKINDVRTCKTCLACYRCGKNGRFCIAHLTCKHRPQINVLTS